MQGMGALVYGLAMDADESPPPPPAMPLVHVFCNP